MEKLPEELTLSKFVWTEADFESMGWHDVRIYGLSFEYGEDAWTADLLLDIDYLFKWVCSGIPGQLCEFWVAPCTLIFKNAIHLKMDLDTQDSAISSLEFSALLLTGTTSHPSGYSTYHWNLNLQQGSIQLDSSGFTQIARQQPLLVKRAALTMEERGGLSFSKQPGNPG